MKRLLCWLRGHDWELVNLRREVSYGASYTFWFRRERCLHCGKRREVEA